MKKTKKTPVFFIATKMKEQPVRVSFYTHSGHMVSNDKVTKSKSSRGALFFASL